MTDPRYPIGKFQPPAGPLTPAERGGLIAQIAALPGLFRRAVSGLTAAQLDTPYRDGGWTVRQLAHHVPDSHLNAYVRVKLALTEDVPTIKTYEEKLWAGTPEVAATPVEVSLTLLDALHRRWVTLLEALGPGEFARTFQHPEWGARSIEWLVAQYAWHGRHHTAHVTTLRERMGWRIA